MERPQRTSFDNYSLVDGQDNEKTLEKTINRRKNKHTGVLGIEDGGLYGFKVVYSTEKGGLQVFGETRKVESRL